ncbi:DUF1579 domain-containing protein [Peristeroidobacter agariperforans]|uniref:DUF1579 domain-containing protein n=1 Tax=Peristeroidobacter agariperforans TaxID=268404 RepID=UPI00101C2C36|nr:DUF1579 domain-containing protein [Peristeroidobacter agariperforans]
MTLPLENSAPRDFDFIIGDWTVKHRRLNERLAGCTSWTEFSGRSSTRKTLGGFGNIEDNILHFPEATFRAIAVRSYCAKTGTWSIWWLDGRNPMQLDKPVLGKFSGSTGLFYTDDVFDGKAIKIRFTWICSPNEDPRWEQAFSSDDGATWETNWTMQFTAVGEPAKQRGG